MRSDGIVLSTPLLDNHLRLVKRVEDLAVQHFIPKLAIETLDVAILPGTARLDEQRFRPELLQPGSHLLTREL